MELRSKEHGIRKAARSLLAKHATLVAKHATVTLQKAIPLVQQPNLLPIVWPLLSDDIVG